MATSKNGKVKVIHPHEQVAVFTAENGLVGIRVGDDEDAEFILVHPEGAIAAGEALFKAGQNGRAIIARGGQPSITEPNNTD